MVPVVHVGRAQPGAERLDGVAVRARVGEVDHEDLTPAVPERFAS